MAPETNVRPLSAIRNTLYGYASYQYYCTDSMTNTGTLCCLLTRFTYALLLYLPEYVAELYPVVIQLLQR